MPKANKTLYLTPYLIIFDYFSLFFFIDQKFKILIFFLFYLKFIYFCREDKSEIIQNFDQKMEIRKRNHD